MRTEGAHLSVPETSIPQRYMVLKMQQGKNTPAVFTQGLSDLL